ALEDFEKLPSSCKSPEKESEPSTAKDLEPGPKDSNEPSLDNWGLSDGDIEAAAAEFEKSMKTMLGQDEELLRQWNEFAEQAASSNPDLANGGNESLPENVEAFEAHLLKTMKDIAENAKEMSGSHYTSPFMNGNKPIPPSKDDELPGEPNNTSTATVIDNLTSTDNPTTTGYMTTEDSTTTTTTKTRNKVLLQTAVTGSQRSYITNSLKKGLGLVPIRTETLNLNTFGDDHFKKRRCDIVQLSLKGNSDNRKITALCFPSLCSPLTTTIDLSLYPHLQELQLSDLNIIEGRQNDSSIDILIAADYYFDILTGEMVRGESGPVAVNSDFGWVVTGPTSDTESCSKVSGVHLLIEEQCSLLTPSSFALREDESELSKCLSQFWEIESMGINEEKVTKEEFLKDIRYLENEARYE
ncbi:Hypothetical predicted protein, partial [Paramuricea clavata]